MNRELKVLLCDLGNTLVEYHSGGLTDDEKDILGVLNISHLLRKWGVPIELGVLHAQFYQEWLMKTARRSTRNTEVSVEKILWTAVPSLADDAKRTRKVLLALHEPYIRFVELHDGVHEVIEIAKRRNLQLALIANSPVPGYCHDAALSQLGILDAFEARFYSYDIGVRKPRQEFFRIVLDTMRVLPAQAAVVGDSYRLDIQPAVDMGMLALWYQPADRQKRQRGSRRVRRIESLRDLGNVI